MAKQSRSQRKLKDSSFFSSLSPTRQDLLCIGLLFVITVFLFKGIVIDDMAFSAAGDTAAALSYHHAGETIKENEGIDPLWMPYFFSGMPTFGNVAYVPHDVSYVQKAMTAVLGILFLNSTWGWLVMYYFLGGVFMFFLMRIWSTSRIASLFAAITFMMSPYAIGLAGEGHGSKLMALSYLPMVFLLTHLLFEKRNILSFGLLAIGVGTLLLTNHMQIVYYVLMVVGLYLLYNIVADFKIDKLLITKKTLLFAGAIIVGLCISSYIYLAVYEYAQYSIRGGGTTGSTGGLSWDYATNWSFHPQELLTLLIPSFFGFQNPYYWGTMPFTNSTVYVGLLPMVLSVIALFYRRTRVTIFFAVLALLVFMMSFGKHFAFVYELLFTYLPFFNKFRVPVMALHLLPFIFGILGAFGLEYLLSARESEEGESLLRLSRIIRNTLAIFALLFVAAFILKSSLQEWMSGFMFLREGEVEMYTAQLGAQAAKELRALKQIRFERLAADYVKFILIGGAVLGLILACIKKKMGITVFAALVLILLFVDLFVVIKNGNFIDPKPNAALRQSFQPDATVQFLKSQEGVFRMYPIGQPYGDNTFAYHGIHSIGGYSPAKLKIYQEMVDSAGLYPPRFPLNMNVINMLNAKYIVVPGRLPDEGQLQIVNVDEAKRQLTYYNPDHLPRAWFVAGYEVATNNQEKFRVLLSPDFSPRDHAVLEEEPSSKPEQSDSSNVMLQKFGAHEIRLKTFSTHQSLLVLSEIYYPAGWRATVDGMDTPIYRTNSILRSVVVPAGDHSVVFSFAPPTYDVGLTLSNAGWIFAGLLIVAGAWKNPSIRNRFSKGKKPGA